MSRNPDWLKNSRLAPQSYGIAMSQCRFGGPRGIWLECRGCDRNDVIVGSNTDEWAARPTSDAAKVFRKYGWSGEGKNMTAARCPDCSAAAQAA